MMAEETSSAASIDNLLNDLDEMIAFEDSGELGLGNDEDSEAPLEDSHHHAAAAPTKSAADIVEPTIPFQSSTTDVMLGDDDCKGDGDVERSLHHNAPTLPAEASYESFAIDASFDRSEGSLNNDDETTEAVPEEKRTEEEGSDAKKNAASATLENTNGVNAQKNEVATAFENNSTISNNGEKDVGVRPRLGKWFSSSRSGLQVEIEGNNAQLSQDSNGGVHTEQVQAGLARRGLGRIATSLRNLRETAATLDHIQASKVRARATAMDPHSFITSPNAKARTLSISDHHATILLIRLIPTVNGNKSNDNGEPTIIRALLKLSLAPFHKMPLGKRPMTAADYFDQKFSADDEKASASILWFLSNYSFSMTSDSGAEYSYYDAVPHQSSAVTGQNRVAGEVGLAQSLNMALQGIAGESPKSTKSKDAGSQSPRTSLSDALMLGGFKVEFIAPATDQQIRQEMPKPSSSLVQETPELFQAVTKPYIDKILAGDSLDWIEDIVKGKTNTNGILFETNEYFLHIDTLWKNHPDPRAVPPEEWFEHSSVSDLHIIGMSKADGLSSLRDLRGEHVPLLKSMLDEGLRTIHQLYGLDSDQVRVYIPYPPQSSLYRFHLYYTRIDHTDGCLAESAHLVNDVIQNLQIDGEFYAKRTITCKIRVTDDLYKRVWMHEVSKDPLDDDEDLDVDGDYY